MSRIAYIISAYKDAPHLARLVAALDDRADFYVHIDLNADIHPFEEALGEYMVEEQTHCSIAQAGTDTPHPESPFCPLGRQAGRCLFRFRLLGHHVALRTICI